MPNVSLFERPDRICILIDLYKNKIVSFRRGQAVKGKSRPFPPFSTLIRCFISFAHPELDTNAASSNNPPSNHHRADVEETNLLRDFKRIVVSMQSPHLRISLIRSRSYWLFHRLSKKKKMNNHLKRTDYPFAYKCFSRWEDSEHEILYEVHIFYPRIYTVDMRTGFVRIFILQLELIFECRAKLLAFSTS